MFGDFITLAFDAIVNFISKSVTMYGQALHMPVIIRCPSGGNRGYGPTHSQNMHKHFLGIPNLSLYEMSPIHPVKPVLETFWIVERQRSFLRIKFCTGRIPAGAIRMTASSSSASTAAGGRHDFPGSQLTGPLSRPAAW